MRPTSVIAIVGFVLLGLLAVALAVMQMPARLRVAVGPEEFDHARLMAAFARKLNADRAPVRLTPIRKSDFAAQAAAVDSGEADLASRPQRPDAAPCAHRGRAARAAGCVRRDRQCARARRGRPGGKRVGVLRGSAENLALLDTVLKQAGVERAGRAPAAGARAPGHAACRAPRGRGRRSSAPCWAPRVTATSRCRVQGASTRRAGVRRGRGRGDRAARSFAGGDRGSMRGARCCPGRRCRASR